MKFNFITGFPRSGSTLLITLLNQNPKFYSTISSPLAELVMSTQEAMGDNRESSIFYTDEIRLRILKSLFFNFYRDIPLSYAKEGVVFDNSRTWASKLSLLSTLLPAAKCIICVREIGWIADSFERLHRKNNQQPSGIYSWDIGGNIQTRTKSLMDNLVGYCIDSVWDAVSSEQADKVMLVDYEHLCNNTEDTLKKIYQFIDEEYFEHDLVNFKHEAIEFDRRLGAKGLHILEGPIRPWASRPTLLPLNLFHELNAKNFWRLNNT